MPHSVGFYQCGYSIKAFLGISAEIFISYFFLRLDFDPVTLLLISLWGSASAVIAFDFAVNEFECISKMATINWRSLVFPVFSLLLQFSGRHLFKK